MQNSNNETITLSSSSHDTSSIPGFTSDTLTSYLNGTSMGSSFVISSSPPSATTLIGSTGISYTGSMYYDTSTSKSYVYNGSGGYWSRVGSAEVGEDFKNKFPEWNAFRKLCDEYPGLEKAYENLKLIYSVCYADSLLPKEEK